MYFKNRNQIALIDLAGQLCVADPAGSGQQVVAAEAGACQFPAWSPDGAYLAATSATAAEGLLLVAAAYRTPDGAATRTLYRHDDERPFYLYWSPDSRTISFLAAHPAGLALHLTAADGSAHGLLTVGQPCFWQWSPRAEKVLVHTGADGIDARLEFIPAHAASSIGVPPRDPVHSERPGLFQTPGIAVGGDYWAYTVQARGHSRLVIGCPTATEKLSVPHAGGVAMGWSPVQPLLAYICPPVAARHFYGPLHLLDVLTGEVRMLTLADEVVLAFFWSPNGRYIAYLMLDDSAAPRRSNPTTNGVYTNGSHPATSRRDDPVLQLWVVEVATHERRMLTRFQPSEEFVAQFLPFFDQYALSHRIWSPASDAVVIPGGSDEVQILVVPLGDGQPYPVATGRVAFWSWQ